MIKSILNGLIKTIKKVDAKTLLYVLIISCLINVSVYPDEQAYWLQLYRGHRDGWLINNFLPMCKSFWDTRVPPSWMLGRELLYFLNGLIEKPVYFRGLGVAYFALCVYLFRKLESNVLESGRNGLVYFNSLLLGFIPISLVYLRPESLMLVALLAALIIYQTSENSESHWLSKLCVVIFLFTIEANLHGRSVFMSPVFLYIAISLAIKSRNKFYVALTFGVFAWCFNETLGVYKALYACPEDGNVTEIMNSLRFDPAIMKSGVEALFSELMKRHVEVYSVLKGAVFSNPAGAFPLPHKTFGQFTTDLFGFVKIAISGIFIIVVAGYGYIGYSYKKLSKIYRSRYVLCVLLGLFLYMDVILMKTDRFYEASVVVPVMILIFIYQISIIRMLNFVLSEKINKIVSSAILTIFFIMGSIFVALYGKDLVVKGGVTYLSVRKHNSDKYIDAVHRAAHEAGIDVKNSKLLVGDFYTINYVASGSFPLMSNLFWWFSDKTTSNYFDDYGKLKLLKDLGSDGLIVRCDATTDTVRSIALTVKIDESSSADLNNTLCVINSTMLGSIDYAKKLK